MVQHRDLNWNSYEPISYQGNNHTIAIYWEAEDPESLVRYWESVYK